MSLNNSLRLVMNSVQTTTDGSGFINDSQKVEKDLILVDLAGALGVTKRWVRTRVLTGTESHDFTGGVTDRMGNPLTFTENKILYIENASSAGTITVGGGSNPFIGWFTGTIELGPGEFILFFSPTATGKPVVAGTGDVLQVVASVAAMTYEAWFLGE
jgi:hypothetical protein